LASGFCPVERLRQAGINVALGTDGAASNNDLDMFGEMRSAALMGKLLASDAAAVPAAYALEMATINGARALGMDDRIGSIEPGKEADMTAVCFDRIDLTPAYDVLSHLVYAAHRRDVTDVWVRGRRVLDDGRLTSIDERDLLSRARRWGERVQSRLFASTSDSDQGDCA
jgi:5-methylthioadenosine/S-adenosylhomocysteine deaminase